MTSLISYFEEYALLSLEKQEKLAGLIGEHISELDLDTGTIRFSDSLVLPFQVLGTESDNTLTWLWAWAEEQTEIPADLIRSSLEMKAWGETQGISECTLPSVDLNRADGRLLALIASHVCRASCFYADEYEGGSLYLLLFGQEIDRQPSFDVAALSRQFSFLISIYEFNHRTAFRSYLEKKNLEVSEHASFIVSRLESGEDVRANFDASGRILSINGAAMPLE